MCVYVLIHPGLTKVYCYTWEIGQSHDMRRKAARPVGFCVSCNTVIKHNIFPKLYTIFRQLANFPSALKGRNTDKVALL